VAWVQARQLHSEAQEEVQTELALLGELVLEPLLRSDYAATERLIRTWVKRRDYLVQITAVMPNGFVLTDVRKEQTVQDLLPAEQEITFGGRHLMTLHAISDYSLHHGSLVSIVFKASVGAVVLVLLLGWVLWVTLHRTAIRPLEEQIRQREAKERELHLRTAELEAAIQEIESFSYSVSHDLRAPLRAIDGFSRILIEDHADRLDAEARAALDRVRGAVQRMGGLIDDLLELSRVGRVRMERTTVDLSHVASEVVEQLRTASPGRRVEVVIPPGLQVRGDEQLLRLIVENLLDNAWKYTGRTAAARIEFGRRAERGETAYFVRDNGAGFDMQYVGKLFQPFQRLHRTEEFEGTGVGLATVARIVHRHGGRVWAEGEIDKGASFYFTLP
jgi:signal transduction histidine kinase